MSGVSVTAFADEIATVLGDRGRTSHLVRNANSSPTRRPGLDTQLQGGAAITPGDMVGGDG